MSDRILRPGKKSWTVLCFMPLLALICLGLMACAQGSSVGGTGPGLGKIDGATVIGPGGKTHLSVFGSGTGPISWTVLPTGLGDFVVDKPQFVAQPTSPPSGYQSTGTFFAGPTLGTCDLIATAGTGGATYRSVATLRIVQGIAILLSDSQVILTAGYQKEIKALVVHPNYPLELIPQGVTWTPDGDFADGRIIPLLPGRLLFVAPTILGTYAIRGKADADPNATALIRVTVQ